MSLDPQALYVELGRLAQTYPMLAHPVTTDEHEWLARLSALLDASGFMADAAQLKVAISALAVPYGAQRGRALFEIKAILYRALVRAELAAPVAARGAFIPVGEPLDAFATVHKVLSAAKSDALIVDPYLDAKALLDFAPCAPERVPLRLLADEKKHVPTLLPATRRWIEQHGADRPLQARLAAARVLHDRLIIVDRRDVWDVSQSLKDLAARSPASITRADADGAAMKVDFYDDIWNKATPIA